MVLIRDSLCADYLPALKFKFRHLSSDGLDTCKAQCKQKGWRVTVTNLIKIALEVSGLMILTVYMNRLLAGRPSIGGGRSPLGGHFT